MAGKIAPLQDTQIPALAEFLRGGLMVPGASDLFREPDVLRWKYFADRGSFASPRSFVIENDRAIAAHAGLMSTSFGPANSTNVPAVHIVDWLTSKEGAAFGAVLMMRALALAPVAYAFGCTPAAARVLLRTGYEVVCEVPLFHRVIRRSNPGVWNQLYGRGRSAKRAAMFSLDLMRSLRPLPRSKNLTLRPVERFGDEVQPLLEKSALAVTCTSRSPEILNHYLSFPNKRFQGFLLSDGQTRGFAILNLLDYPHLRLARIVECFLDTTDATLWRDATSLLTAEATARGADLLSSYGSTSWMAAGLTSAGFFRRGKTPFYLRDPKKLVPRNRPFHLTHLEADVSFL